MVRRHISNYAEGLFSSDDLNRILNECNVRFGVNLDVTTYQDGRRETHNVEGRAFSPVVWDYYKVGCCLCNLILEDVYVMFVSIEWLFGPIKKPTSVQQTRVAALCHPAGIFQEHGRLQHVSAFVPLQLPYFSKFCVLPVISLLLEPRDSLLTMMT